MLAEGRNHPGKTLFLNSLQQVLDPIENPRYLLHRESRGWFATRRDYHAVPEEIDVEKSMRNALPGCGTSISVRPSWSTPVRRKEENAPDRANAGFVLHVREEIGAG